jgi:glycosyltransferase involved in cell wall biosynthesis
VPRLPKKDDPPLTPASKSTLQGRRIIFVLFNLELGGAERQSLILARHLVQHEKAKVEVWGFNKTGPVAQICDQLGLPWRIVPYPLKGGSFGRKKLPQRRNGAKKNQNQQEDFGRSIFPPSRFRGRLFAPSLVGVVRLALSLRRARPDVLLPYTFVPNVLCGLIWKWTGARACVWNQRDEGVMRFVTEWGPSAARRTRVFVSNSEAGARFLIDELKVDSAQVRVIENGIEQLTPQADRAAWRARLEIADDSFVACMVANLHDNKDHRTLLKAWRRVVDSSNGRNAVLVLAGRHDGAYESIAALARELKLNGHVRFAGQVLDVAGLLSAADISVFSSATEGSPNAVLESMAAGLAVAGTNIEGIRSALGPTGSQLLAPPRDEAALAAAILKLANDTDLRNSIGAANRERVKAQYAAARMCEEYVAVLNEMLNETRA